MSEEKNTKERLKEYQKIIGRLKCLNIIINKNSFLIVI